MAFINTPPNSKVELVLGCRADFSMSKTVEVMQGVFSDTANEQSVTERQQENLQTGKNEITHL